MDANIQLNIPNLKSLPLHSKEHAPNILFDKKKTQM